MELNAKITIKKAIADHNGIAKKLTVNEPLAKDIAHFAALCGFTPEFINHNIKIIKNWI